MLRGAPRDLLGHPDLLGLRGLQDLQGLRGLRGLQDLLGLRGLQDLLGLRGFLGLLVRLGLRGIAEHPVTVWRLLDLPPPVGSYAGPTRVRHHGGVRVERYVNLDSGQIYLCVEVVVTGRQRWAVLEGYGPVLRFIRPIPADGPDAA